MTQTLSNSAEGAKLPEFPWWQPFERTDMTVAVRRVARNTAGDSTGPASWRTSGPGASGRLRLLRQPQRLSHGAESAPSAFPKLSLSAVCERAG
jgi:hypothetical protein